MQKTDSVSIGNSISCIHFSWKMKQNKPSLSYTNIYLPDNITIQLVISFIKNKVMCSQKDYVF